MSEAVKIWRNHFEILRKIKSKRARNALAFALISYGFTQEIEQDLDQNSQTFILFEAIKNQFIAKNQGGAPIGNNNRTSTVEKNNIQQKAQKKQPLLDNIYKIIDNNKEIRTNVLTKKMKKFIPPTLDEIETYINEKNLSVCGRDFFNYFEEGDWVDSRGQKVLNWKQKILTWEKNGVGKRNIVDKPPERTLAEKQREEKLMDEMINRVWKDD